MQWCGHGRARSGHPTGTAPFTLLPSTCCLLPTRLASPGGTVDLATALPGRGFVSGILRCPQNDVVCPQLGCKVACVNGQCHNGRCVCAMAFTGERCEKSLVPGWT